MLWPMYRPYRPSMANLPQVIGPSQKLRDTVRMANERLPVSYAEAKQQVDRIQGLVSPRGSSVSKDSRKNIGF